MREIAYPTDKKKNDKKITYELEKEYTEIIGQVRSVMLRDSKSR